MLPSEKPTCGAHYSARLGSCQARFFRHFFWHSERNLRHRPQRKEPGQPARAPPNFNPYHPFQSVSPIRGCHLSRSPQRGGYLLASCTLGQATLAGI